MGMEGLEFLKPEEEKEHMTIDQRAQSQVREERISELSPEGQESLEGSTLRFVKTENGWKIIGKIDGHTVDIEKGINDKYSGVVNGVGVGSLDAKDLYMKYHDLAKLAGSEMDGRVQEARANIIEQDL